jgi:hypothetical protein
MNHMNTSQGRMSRRRAVRDWSAGLAAFAMLWMAPVGCRSRRTSPEDQVRETIAAVARAIEDKDLKAVRARVAEGYRDAEEHDRPEMMATLQLLFRRHERIYLLTRMTSVGVAATGEARAVVVAAMASTPLKVAEDLARVRADAYRFDLTLVRGKGDDWQVAAAAWQAARPEDLF